MCPYLEEAAKNNYCGMSARMLGDRRVRTVCETGSFYDCSSYNGDDYNSDSGYSSYKQEENRTEHEEEDEYEYNEE